MTLQEINEQIRQTRLSLDAILDGLSAREIGDQYGNIVAIEKLNHTAKLLETLLHIRTRIALDGIEADLRSTPASSSPVSDSAPEPTIKAAGDYAAPRVTQNDIEKQIVVEHYFTARGAVATAGAVQVGSQTDESIRALMCLTFCVLVLRNGFTVTGESICASPDVFDTEHERMIARRNAQDKIFALEDYRLKTDLHRAAQAGESHGVAQSSSQSTENQQKSFEQAARPLIKWLAENVHPHHSVYVTSTHAELLEGSCCTGQITEYLRD